ncbi:uncharacterized protein TNCV_4113591 [Trichonephila clavipes]|nr:uncharacterized protein TNCV_4113591 [Trichonephila clavipes]
MVYADKPQTLDHLEDNIRCVIADIRPQMLEKVIENSTSRLDYIGASHGSHMPEIIFKINLELEVNEDNIEELIMGHEDELTTELQEILNEEHQETHQNVSPSEKDEDESVPMPTSAIKDLLKKWADERTMVLEWHPN